MSLSFRKNFLSLTTVFISAVSFSTALASEQTGAYWALGAQGGWSQLRGIDETLYINPNKNPLLINTLQQTANNGGSSIGAGLSYGYRFKARSHALSFANGIEGSVNWGRVTGTIEGALNPTINTGTYSMAVKSNRVMVDARFIGASWRFIDLFFQVGLGAAWNSVSYSDIHNPSQTQMSLTLNEHTQTQFAWEVGSGLRFQLMDNLSLLAGYTYVDLGKATIGTQGTQQNGTPIFVQSAPSFNVRAHTEWLGLQWNF